MEAFASMIASRLTTDPGGNLYAVGFAIDSATQGSTGAAFSISRTGMATRLPGNWILPQAIATDNTGALFIGDSGFCGGRQCTFPPSAIQRIAADGVISPIPVKSNSDNSFGGSVVPQTLAGLATASGLVVDARGNFYFGDGAQIFKLSADGDLTTIAGQLGAQYEGEVDGVGRDARFAGATGLALGPDGNLYLADVRGQTIRKIDVATKAVTTIAGMPFVAGSADGAGQTATFNAPMQITVSPSKDIYVADSGNGLIRKVSANGVVSTIAGTRGATGFIPGPLPGVIDPPFGLALSGTDLYFSMQNAIGVIRNVP